MRLSKKVQVTFEENADIKERLSKLEGLEKMIAIFCPIILFRGVNNSVGCFNYFLPNFLLVLCSFKIIVGVSPIN